MMRKRDVLCAINISQIKKTDDMGHCHERLKTIFLIVKTIEGILF